MITTFLEKYEKLIIVGVFLILSGIAYWFIYENYTHPMPGRVYLGFNYFPLDTLGGLGGVQAGYRGEWLHYPQTTTAIPAAGKISRVEYILIGQLARFIRVNPFNLYWIVRFLLSGLYIWAIWQLTLAIFSKPVSRILAVLLSLFGTGIVIETTYKGWSYYHTSDAQVLLRFTLARPHYMIAGILFILSVLFLEKALRRRSKRDLGVSCMLGFGSMQPFFPPMLLLIMGFIPYSIMRIIHDGWKKYFRTEFAMLSIYAIFSSLPLIYLKYLGQFYDYNLFQKMESLFIIRFSWWDYLALVGMESVWAVLALICIVRKNNRLLQLLLGWIIFHPIMILWGAGKLQINPLRFIQTPFAVVMGILAVVGIEGMSAYITKHLPKFRQLFFAGIGIFFSVQVLLSWKAYWMSWWYMTTRDPYESNNSLGYVAERDYKAMQWLETHVSYADIMLTFITNGTLIQSLTPHKVFITDWIKANEVPGYKDIINTLIAFYGGSMTPTVAKNYLKQYQIKYVYYGTEEERVHREYPGPYFPYPGLVPIYKEDGVVIYQVE